MQSMTGYGRCRLQGDLGEADWEIRSLNHRHLDVSFKIPERFREFEQQWRTRVGECASRGKVECLLRFTPSASTSPHMVFNQGLLTQLMDAATQIPTPAGVEKQLNIMDLLRWPEVVHFEETTAHGLEAHLGDALAKALAQWSHSRSQEGHRLAQVLMEKVKALCVVVAKCEELAPTALQMHREKLHARLAEWRETLDASRLEQEVVFHAQRVDVQEEIDRLKSHAEEVQTLLQAKEPTGRRIDFLIHEMMREANTLGAKVSLNRLSRLSTDLKVLIDQMREQVHNLE